MRYEHATFTVPLVFACVADAAMLTMTIHEGDSDAPLPCRVHLYDPAGQPVRAASLPFWKDHFVCPGIVVLDLPAGRYRYEIERGPEYRPAAATIDVGDGPLNVRVALHRTIDMAARGWWSGDLHVHRAVEEVPLLMRAEDLRVAPVITWWNDNNAWKSRPLPDDPLVMLEDGRVYHVMAGEDERQGGALLYFNLTKPLEIAGAGREHPSPMRFLAEARRHVGSHVDVEKPFWWDVPVWVAGEQVDTIGLANNHMCRSQMYENEAWGRPRDANRLPPPHGNGYWSQEIYYHLLNCGLRLPPSAGSASGVLPNPVGYNRVYVQHDGPLDHEQWWRGLRAGRSIVTNGPLLIPSVNGHSPGHVFAADAGEAIELDLKVELVTHDPVTTIDVVVNGTIERSVPVAKWRETRTLGTIQFKESGWLLIRAIAENPRTFRFASTAPYYIEVGESKRRVSRASAKFFVDWVDEREARVNIDNAAQRAEVLEYHDAARRWWRRVYMSANAP